MKRTLYWLVIPVVSALSACTDGGGSAATGAPHGAGSLVQQGYKLYVGRCTACHAPEPVTDFTRAEWAEILPEMAEESNLNAQQTEALRAYVHSLL